MQRLRGNNHPLSPLSSALRSDFALRWSRLSPPLRHAHSLAIAVPVCSGKSQDAAKAEYIALVEALAANEA
jgi:hypothetical protein